MDLQALLGTLLSANSVNQVTGKTGASQKDTMSILAAALPALLDGANNQAQSEETAVSFQQATVEHANKEPNDVDLAEGEKIIAHLLGKDTAKTEKEIAKKTGLDKKTVALVLAAAAPIIMNLLGKNSGNNSSASLLSALLGGGNSNSNSNGGSNALVMAALAALASSALSNNNNNSYANNNSGDLLGSLLGGVLGGNSKPQQQSSLSSDLLSGLMGLLK